MTMGEWNHAKMDGFINKIMKNWRLNTWLHKVASHPLVFPCAKGIEWIMKHVDHEQTTIKDNHINLITSFNALGIKIYYKLPKEEMTLDED